MKKFHVNAEGNIGVCHAKMKCPFGNLENEHFTDEVKARKYSEFIHAPTVSVHTMAVKGDNASFSRSRLQILANITKIHADNEHEEKIFEKLGKFSEGPVEQENFSIRELELAKEKLHKWLEHMVGDSEGEDFSKVSRAIYPVYMNVYHLKNFMKTFIEKEKEKALSKIN